MEGDEMEMTIEELEKWIRGQVKKNERISRDLLRKCNLLQSLLKRRENHAAHLLKLCESVAACEVIVKKQYSLLGWKYRDTDSDDDDDITGCGNTPRSPCETQGTRSPTTNGPAPLLPKLGDSENLYRDRGKTIFINLKRQPVVVLTRLPPYVVSFFSPPTPQSHDSEEESSDDLDCDMDWEPDDSSDSDNSISNSPHLKRRKTDQKNEKLAKGLATPQANTKSGATSKTMKTSVPPANTNATKTQDPPGVPEGKIIVNMDVLARRRAMDWQKGKIVDIVKKDGRLKYKINFEDKGKILVSGHHIAFDYMPKLQQLFIGARVVVNCKAEKPLFYPGVVAEVPCRKNKMRFLVFFDNHTPVYVGLPVLHLVCRPLADPLDDIVDDTHKEFMKAYIKAWPYLPRTHYRVGLIINAELNGVQQECVVLAVDCSLIQVAFLKDQRKEWIYKGSMRLEYTTREEEQKKASTTVNESSKLAH